MAMVSDTVDVATAVKRRGGVVIVAVGMVAHPAHAGQLLLPAALVSYIVVDPELEQVIGATHASPWPFLLLGSPVPAEGGRRAVDAVNRTLRVTPTRGALDELAGRLGALLVCRHVRVDLEHRGRG